MYMHMIDWYRFVIGIRGDTLTPPPGQFSPLKTSVGIGFREIVRNVIIYIYITSVTISLISLYSERKREIE